MHLHAAPRRFFFEALLDYEFIAFVTQTLQIWSDTCMVRKRSIIGNANAAQPVLIYGFRPLFAGPRQRLAHTHARTRVCAQAATRKRTLTPHTSRTYLTFANPSIAGIRAGRSKKEWSHVRVRSRSNARVRLLFRAIVSREISRKHLPLPARPAA
eukprot:6179800-Pleurochrysis_carterae.AAC.1